MIIGVVAPSGSGKTVVSKHLAKRHGFAKLHAGAPVKKAMRAGFGLSKAEVGGDDKIDQPIRAFGGVPPRLVTDAVSEAIHEHAPLATAIALGHQLDRKMAGGKDVVVDGVRSQHEADAIHRRGGVILRVSREDNRSDPALAMDKMQAAVKADHTIKRSTGDGNKDALRGEVDKLVFKLMRA